MAKVEGTAPFVEPERRSGCQPRKEVTRNYPQILPKSQTFDHACTILQWYKERWLIEEFFKALKTGCRLEDRQLRSSNGLEALCCILCVTALEILRLKRLAQTEPSRPAREVVPPLWIEMLRRALQCQHRHVETIEGFYRSLARLGGFLGCHSDGAPGWQKIRLGWDKLNSMIRGAEVLTQMQ